MKDQTDNREFDPAWVDRVMAIQARRSATGSTATLVSEYRAELEERERQRLRDHSVEEAALAKARRAARLSGL